MMMRPRAMTCGHCLPGMSPLQQRVMYASQFGQAPALPPLPGYVTETQHAADMQAADDKRKSYVAGALTGGLLLGFMFGRLTKIL